MSEASAVPDLTVHTMYPPDSGAIAAAGVERKAMVR